MDAPEVGRRGVHPSIELPEIRARVTEHRLLSLACPACVTRTRAALPADVKKGFGPRLTALGTLLVSRFRLNRRDLVVFFGDVLDVPAPAAPRKPSPRRRVRLSG